MCHEDAVVPLCRRRACDDDSDACYEASSLETRGASGLSVVATHWYECSGSAGIEERDRVVGFGEGNCRCIGEAGVGYRHERCRAQEDGGESAGETHLG